MTDLERYERLLRYELACQDAGERLLPFSRFTMPHPRFPHDPTKSRYDTVRAHEKMADLLEAMERGDVRKAIVTLPPRMGKTQTVHHNGVSWMWGRNPDWDIISATYGETFARDHKNNIKTILDGQRFRQAFPEFAVRQTGPDELMNHLGGHAYFLGRRSPTTGRGANCFPAGTLVQTDRGQVPIEDIISSTSSYSVVSLTDGGTKLQSIAATLSRSADGLRRVTTAAGRVVYATRDHPFLTCRGWIAARDVAPGDRLLCLVRAGEGQDGARDAEVRGARPDEPLLLSRVLGSWGERETPREAALRRVRGTSAEMRVARDEQGAGMLARLSQGAIRAADGAADRGAAGRMSDLPALLSCSAAGLGGSGGLLLAGVRECRPFSPHVLARQSEVEGRGDGAPAEARRQGVLPDAADGPGAGSVQVRRLRLVDSALGGASPRRGSDEQRALEPRHALLSAPSSVARGEGPEAEYDTVALVEDVCGDVTVYDLQVEGEHNFFANGICVHNCIIVDDPVKDDKEGRSQVYRDDVWEWFTQTLWTRRHHDRVPVLVTMTRWHDDDIVGRITDKSNPKYAPKFADGWEHLRLAAIAEEDDPIGRAPGEALWPERYGVAALEEMRDANPVAFSALYQGDPAPEDGVFYLAEDIHTYDREDLERVRSSLVYYAASDHAVATTQINDLTCMGVFGVDPTGTAYLMPDLVWRRINAEEAVEQMLRLIKAHKPRWWYAERGHITRAIGPFLKKRMQEEGVYCPIIEDQPVADKTQRAQSARARVAQGKIRFPAYASWWPKAKSEMLRFPNARHDDFVDMLSTIGLKLQSHVTGTFKTPKQAPKEGTWAWQKEQWALEDRSRRRWG